MGWAWPGLIGWRPVVASVEPSRWSWSLESTSASSPSTMARDKTPPIVERGNRSAEKLPETCRPNPLTCSRPVTWPGGAPLRKPTVRERPTVRVSSMAEASAVRRHSPETREYRQKDWMPRRAAGCTTTESTATRTGPLTVIRKVAPLLSGDAVRSRRCRVTVVGLNRASVVWGAVVREERLGVQVGVHVEAARRDWLGVAIAGVVGVATAVVVRVGLHGTVSVGVRLDGAVRDVLGGWRSVAAAVSVARGVGVGG